MLRMHSLLRQNFTYCLCLIQFIRLSRGIFDVWPVIITHEIYCPLETVITAEFSYNRSIELQSDTKLNGSHIDLDCED